MRRSLQVRLARHDYGIGGVVGAQAIIYVRDARGSTWTRAYPNGPDVAERAFQEWQKDREGWHYAPGDLDVSEVSTVFAVGEGRLMVTGMGAITMQKLTEHRVDRIVSLTPLTLDATRAIVHLQRERTLHHHACPVRDLTPQHWGEADNANARGALAAVSEGLERGERVVVHCLMGIHRSPALAMAVIAKRTGSPLSEAARIVRSKRALAQWIPPTAERFAELLATID